MLGLAGVRAHLPGARTLPHRLSGVCELLDFLCVQISIQLVKDPGSVDTFHRKYFKGKCRAADWEKDSLVKLVNFLDTQSRAPGDLGNSCSALAVEMAPHDM